MGNGSSKYFKSTTKTKTKTKAKKGNDLSAAEKYMANMVQAYQYGSGYTPANVTPKYTNDNKVGSVHERNSGTGVASKPATVTASTATTAAAPNNNNKITQSVLLDNNVDRDPRGATQSAWAANADKAWNASMGLTTTATKKASANVSSINSGVDAGLLSSLSTTSSKAAKVNAVTTDNSNRSILFDPTSRDKFINNGETKTAVDSKFSKSTSTDKNDGTNLSFNNDTVAAKDKYNQAYWANQIAPKNIVNGKNIGGAGLTQAEIKKAMDAAGGKVYSGASVVSDANMKTGLDTLKRVTGSDAVVGDGVTREWTQSGLLGTKVRGDFTWDDGTKVTTMADNPVVGGTFNPVTGRFDGGVRLGDYNSTTFVGTGNYTGKTAGTNEVGGTSKTGDQVAVASVVGGNDGLGEDAETVLIDAEDSVTLDDIITKKVDITTLTVEALTTVIDEITTVIDIDKVIEETKDPEILKSLYKRRLKLMRLNGSRTRFAGLLDDADTKKSQMSIV